MRFPTAEFETIPESFKLEEEGSDSFKRGCYFLANIGDVLVSWYQVVGKLGYGISSTVWLARDLKCVDAERRITV